MTDTAPTWRRRLLAVVREPLLHFLVGGVALFGLWHLLGPGVDEPPPPATEIRIDGTTRTAILAAHAKQRGGSAVPAEERDAVIERWIRDEVLVREARRLGLADGDEIVRRRLIQLMEFVLDNSVEVREPTDADLTAWIEANPTLYTRAERVDLTHVFVDPARHDDPDARLATLRAALDSGADPTALGDAFPRDRVLRGWSRTRLGGEFGTPFAAAFDAPVGSWSGPFESAFGRHLVHIDARHPEAVAPLDDVRARARADWLSSRRERIREDAIDALVERYDVTEVE